MPYTRVFIYNPSYHAALIPVIVDLHAACVEQDHALVRFHPPFTAEKRHKMHVWWEERLSAVKTKRKVVLLSTTSRRTPNSDQAEPHNVEFCKTSADGASGVSDTELSGIVELGMSEAETGPFRGEVEMLMVSPKFRQLGLGKKLMGFLEEIAIKNGRTLLQLGTTVGSAADVYLYPKLGYTKIGVVPRYGIEPVTNKLVDGVYFYKDLRHT